MVVCLVIFYFNSIKVRLKHGNRYLASRYDRDFNSIKVRLKPVYSIYNFRCSSFQFHKGTIKTDRFRKELQHAAISIP